MQRKKNLNANIIEIKKDNITTEVIADTLFIRSYLTQYAQLCSNHNLKLKECTIWFVAPLIDKSAVDLKNEFNKEIKTINDIKVKIQVASLQTFIKNIIDETSKEKWYSKNQVLSIVKSAFVVDYLIENGLAKII